MFWSPSATSRISPIHRSCNDHARLLQETHIHTFTGILLHQYCTYDFWLYTSTKGSVSLMRLLLAAPLYQHNPLGHDHPIALMPVYLYTWCASSDLVRTSSM